MKKKRDERNFQGKERKVKFLYDRIKDFHKEKG